jgi:hypothetical protein
MAAPQFRRLVTGSSPQRTVFAARAVRAGFVMDEVALGQDFLRGPRFSFVTVIPPLLHMHSCIVWGVGNWPVKGRSSTKT